MKKILKNKYMFILIFSILAIIVSAYYLYNPFISELTIEAGKKVTINDFIDEKNIQNPYIITDINTLIKQVGKHEIKLSANGHEYKSYLNVIDTIPPKAEVIKKTIWLGDKIEAKEFVKNIEDFSDVTVSYQHDISLNQEGKQRVNLLLEDSFENTTLYTSELIIKKDTEAPVISTVNVINVSKGENISYKKNISVHDNRDTNPILTIDNSKVNLNKPGLYNVIVTASDKSGNISHKTIQVRVLNDSKQRVKEQALHYADLFIEKICKKSNNKDQNLKLACDYIRANVIYNGKHEGSMEDYYKDALTGFKTLKGDCLVSNSMARVVCERLDIPTIAVNRIQNKNNHYWFLANTGDGWYHYDTYVRKNEPYIYKWTDAKMDEFNKRTRASLYDKSKYPRTPLK